MQSKFVVAVFLLFSAAAVAQVRSFDLGQYQGSDGAITLTPNGNEVEPYFATKALLVAQDAGLDTHDAAVKWIAWVLPHQRSDGRIDRYCKKKTPDWRKCREADADDSMMALWTELLYRNATDQGLPLEWQQSAEKAFAYEKRLKTGGGVYVVSRKNQTALFMDNVEVYSSFKDIGKQLSRWDLNDAAVMQAQSQELANSIQHVFWDEALGRFRPSTQNTRPGFYPDAVGQTYPWLAGMPTPQDPQHGWTDWKQQFAGGWLRRKYDPHPWGLVAVAALKLNDSQTASCWLQQAISGRGNQYWNILEEATYQAVQANAAQGRGDSCSELMSGQ